MHVSASHDQKPKHQYNMHNTSHIKHMAFYDGRLFGFTRQLQWEEMLHVSQKILFHMHLYMYAVMAHNHHAGSQRAAICTLYGCGKDSIISSCHCVHLFSAQTEKKKETRVLKMGWAFT